MKTLFYEIIILSFCFFTAGISYSQQTRTCEGYIIVREGIFPKIASKYVDSIFLTENYCYTVARPVYYSESIRYCLADFKRDSVYFLFYYPPDTLPSHFEGNDLLDGKYVWRLGRKQGVDGCPEVTFLKERKEIKGFKAQKIKIIEKKPFNKEGWDTSFAFVSPELKLDKGCYPGFILEYDSPGHKYKTLSIKKAELPQDMYHFALEGAMSIEEFYKRMEKFRELNPGMLPSYEEILKLSEEMYGE